MNVFEQIKQELNDCKEQSRNLFDFGISYRTYSDVFEIVERLEKQHNNGWIPVEEKLPEDGVIVLTCDNYENIHVMKHYNFYEYPFSIGPEHERYYMPKVWRPLPEPYKECEKE